VVGQILPVGRSLSTSAVDLENRVDIEQIECGSGTVCVHGVWRCVGGRDKQELIIIVRGQRLRKRRGTQKCRGMRGM
jgi:hypothetical protein